MSSMGVPIIRIVDRSGLFGARVRLITPREYREQEEQRGRVRAERRRIDRMRLSPMLVNSNLFAVAGGSWSGVAPTIPVTSGLYIHLKRGVGYYTDAGTTQTFSDTASVYRWNDDSANGRHGDPYTNNIGLPTYYPKLDVSNQYLNIPTIRFDSSVINGSSNSQCFQFPDMSALTEGEVFIVLKCDNDPNVSASDSGIWRMGSTGAASHYTYVDGNIYDGFGSTSRYTVGNPGPSLASAYRVFNVYSKTNDWQAFLDGSSLFSTGSNTVGFYTTPLLGRNFGDAFLARVSEFIVFNRKLGTTERADMNTYCTAN